MLLSSFADCYEPDRAISNFAHGFTECWAYYSIAADWMRRASNTHAQEEAARSAERATSIALLFSEAETVVARQKFAIQEQAALVKGDFANFSVLLAAYGV